MGNEANTVLLCENYIVQTEKHIAIPNQRYLWFGSMDFIHFFTNYKQDYRLGNDIRFDLFVLPTFKKIRDCSMHNVYLDTLYRHEQTVQFKHNIHHETCTNERQVCYVADDSLFITDKRPSNNLFCPPSKLNLPIVQKLLTQYIILPSWHQNYRKQTDSCTFF